MTHNYDKLQVYQRSMNIAVQIMKIIDDVRPYRLAEQIVSSSISIPSNIAEGSERSSNKEFARFLEYSSGSAAELITQLTILNRANKAYNLNLPHMIDELIEINNMLRSLIAKHGKNLESRI